MIITSISRSSFIHIRERKRAHCLWRDICQPRGSISAQVPHMLCGVQFSSASSGCFPVFFVFHFDSTTCAYTHTHTHTSSKVLETERIFSGITQAKKKTCIGNKCVKFAQTETPTWCKFEIGNIITLCVSEPCFYKSSRYTYHAESRYECHALQLEEGRLGKGNYDSCTTFLC